MARGPDTTAAAARMTASMAGQSSALARMAPLHLLWVACGLIGGLVLRDRVPLTGGHSSPTAAWLAKRLIAASAVAVSAFGLGSLRIDPAWMHPAAVMHSAGWLIYLRNLPWKV